MDARSEEVNISYFGRGHRKSQILDAAEKMVFLGGYNGFSFRDIAGILGVKSASVHYHFKTKELLLISLADKIKDRTFLFLGDPTEDRALINLVKGYRNAIIENRLFSPGSICPGEHGIVPPNLRRSILVFYDELIAWIDSCVETKISCGDSSRFSFGCNKSFDRRCMMVTASIISVLEGASGVSRSSGDIKFFDSVVDEVFGGIIG